jgi:hypothetical protein
MKHLISITGFKGSGKDTVGSLLTSNHGYHSHSFAAPVKQILSVMFDWPLDLLQGVTPQSRQWRETPDPYWSEVMRKPFTPRLAMTMIGTDVVRRRVHHNLWTTLCAKHLSQASGHTVVTDARFTNELQMIKHLGGHTVRVVRSSEPSWYDHAMLVNQLPTWCKPAARWLSPSLRKIHPSETDWIGWKFDHVIYNTGDMDYLSHQVDQLVSQLDLDASTR